MRVCCWGLKLMDFKAAKKDIMCFGFFYRYCRNYVPDLPYLNVDLSNSRRELHKHLLVATVQVLYQDVRNSVLFLLGGEQFTVTEQKLQRCQLHLLVRVVQQLEYALVEVHAQQVLGKVMIQSRQHVLHNCQSQLTVLIPAVTAHAVQHQPLDPALHHLS